MAAHGLYAWHVARRYEALGKYLQKGVHVCALRRTVVERENPDYARRDTIYDLITLNHNLKPVKVPN